MYEDEFELTFNLSGEEPQPEQAAQEPPVPPKPKAASPVVDEPTRVIVLEKPQPAPQPEMPVFPSGYNEAQKSYFTLRPKPFIVEVTKPQSELNI